jgi:orotate phosphoribosyltransferase
MPASARERLLDLIVQHAYVYDPEGRIELSSGQLSKEYIDCKAALTFPEALAAAGDELFARLLPDVQAVGGLTMGADPLATSVSLRSAGSDHPVRWFSVRKEPKGHGMKKVIEGNLPPATRVAVLEDVVTLGGSTLDAIDRLQFAGHVVVQVLALVDREQGGMPKIRATVPNAPVDAIFRKAELFARWQALHPV